MWINSFLFVLRKRFTHGYLPSAEKGGGALKKFFTQEHIFYIIPFRKEQVIDLYFLRVRCAGGRQEGRQMLPVRE
jgi:hypothetical protein